ncbi:WD repeat-containing protein 92 [Tupaia chinensis]|uniref:WD repeat-containing protein 92 n=1 Tax=Tupaia chinensis TaxID=246437 RepID=L9KJ20_TUPCH|nr:WD repeat-containing protein 92 [Tupaia chinensis]
MSAFETPQIIAHIQKGLNYTVFDWKWVPCSAKFGTTGNSARGTSIIQLYEIQHGELSCFGRLKRPNPLNVEHLEAMPHWLQEYNHHIRKEMTAPECARPTYQRPGLAACHQTREEVFIVQLAEHMGVIGYHNGDLFHHLASSPFPQQQLLPRLQTRLSKEKSHCSSVPMHTPT